MRLALAQINPTVGDLVGNASLVIECAEEAQRAGADVVVFPELAVSGYPPEDLLLKEHFLSDCRHALATIASACLDIIAVVGFPEADRGHVYNAAAVLARGRIQASYHKIMLPNYAVFDEVRYFSPGSEVLVVRTPEAALAVNICEDIWYAGGPGEEATLAFGSGLGAPAGRSMPAQVVVNISMSPYHKGKGREREAMLRTRAQESGAFVVYVNGVGGQDELVFDGHSLVIGPDGAVLCRAPQFEPALLTVDIAPELASAERASGAPPHRWPVRFVDVMPGRNTPSCMGCGPAGALRARPGSVHELLAEEAEVYRALCLGTFDYVDKNQFSRVVMGLSGGIDSALVACIAADALGSGGVVGVSMPSRFTSAGSRRDAERVARNLGIEFLEIPIDSVFEAYLEALRAVFGRAQPDVTEENIQARIRGNYLMALSNKFGWLVLTTGNKSEMAVGYATLYGDMAGGFAVIKDVPKTLVYRLARYRNAQDPENPPIPPSVIDRPPSAELRPGQTDQDTLPPYEVLDAIVEGYVVRDESVEQIVAAAGLSRAVVESVVRMIDGNEYKRRQAAPGIRITPKAFGKDRRLPISNRYHG